MRVHIKYESIGARYESVEAPESEKYADTFGEGYELPVWAAHALCGDGYTAPNAKEYKLFCDFRSMIKKDNFDFFTVEWLDEHTTEWPAWESNDLFVVVTFYKETKKK